ncbi:hypothetical protein DV517_47770 [Streptomyces sp. S816]|nr:hypothetical protein DV517_47770 [Streptomyces sp. S816]
MAARGAGGAGSPVRGSAALRCRAAAGAAPARAGVNASRPATHREQAGTTARYLNLVII